MDHAREGRHSENVAAVMGKPLGSLSADTEREEISVGSSQSCTRDLKRIKVRTCYVEVLGLISGKLDFEQNFMYIRYLCKRRTLDLLAATLGPTK